MEKELEGFPALPEIIEVTQRGDINTLRRMLCDEGDDIHVLDECGDTALHWACRGNEAIAIFLIEEGADVNHQNKWGISPVYIACACDLDQVVEKLMEYGGHHNLQSEDGRTALNIVRERTSLKCRAVLDKYRSNIETKEQRAQREERGRKLRALKDAERAEKRRNQESMPRYAKDLIGAIHEIEGTTTDLKSSFVSIRNDMMNLKHEFGEFRSVVESKLLTRGSN